MPAVRLDRSAGDARGDGALLQAVHGVRRQLHSARIRAWAWAFASLLLNILLIGLVIYLIVRR